MFCVNCGKPIESHFKFCPYCAINTSTGTQTNNHNSAFEIVAGKLIKYTGSDVDVVIPDNVIEIGEKAFYSMSQLKSIVIPNSVKVIGRCAFQDCSSLIDITIPKSVTTIESYAFYNCTFLNKVTLSNGVKTIGEYAFSQCISLTDIMIPDSVTALGSSDRPAFCFCNNLANITYPKHFTIEHFKYTRMYEAYVEEHDKKWREQLAKGCCPQCGGKLSFFGNKCKHCNIKY